MFLNVSLLVWVHRESIDQDYLTLAFDPVWCYAGIAANVSNSVKKENIIAPINIQK